MKRASVLLAAVLLIVVTATAGAASSPSVRTGGTSGVTQTSATLLGDVTPNGSNTSYTFQWGLTTGYGSSSSVAGAGSGTKQVAVKTTAAGLIPGTVYHYRLVATNRYGTTAGADRTFTTTGPPPPGAATGPVSAVSTNSATLTGIINPHGATTGYRFEYGLSSTYTTYTMGGTVPAGNAPVTVSETLGGLEKGTIFHFRLVAFHGLTAVSYGADNYFETFPSPRPTPRFTAVTRPGRVRSRPFVFTTSGKVTGPSSTPGVFACTGYVAVRFFFGPRDQTFILAPVKSDCTYSVQTTVPRKPGRGAPNRHVTLNVFARFRGNGYLNSIGARPQRVTVG